MTRLAASLTASIVADEVAARFGVERLSSLYAGKLPKVTREVALSLYTERAKELRAEMKRGLS